jgi:hypothetical protein
MKSFKSEASLPSQPLQAEAPACLKKAQDNVYSGQRLLLADSLYFTHYCHKHDVAAYLRSVDERDTMSCFAEKL